MTSVLRPEVDGARKRREDAAGALARHGKEDLALSDADILNCARQLLVRYCHPRHGGQLPDAAELAAVDALLALCALRASKDGSRA